MNSLSVPTVRFLLTEPTPDIPPDAFPVSDGLVIEGGMLGLTFSLELIDRGTAPNVCDRWAVTISSSHPGGSPAVFLHATPSAPAGGQPAPPPKPYAVLARIASDLSLALAMPAATSDAVDWLFLEGYAVMPADALALHQRLVATLANVALLLAGTGIRPDAFMRHIQAQPVQRAPCMYPGRPTAAPDRSTSA